ncbi:MAG: sugar ABC transporter permease [Anaerolineales bacterium]|nr:sugar ABC transporter permease [Anaerolineales bacterium]
MHTGLKPLGNEKIWVWVLMAPTLIGLAFGALGSILATLGISFFHWDLLTPPVFAGLANYTALFEDRLFRKALVNTLLFVAVRPKRHGGVVGHCVCCSTGKYAVSVSSALRISPAASPRQWRWGWWGVGFMQRHRRPELPHQGGWAASRSTGWHQHGHDVGRDHHERLGRGRRGAIIFLAGPQPCRTFYEAADVDGANRWSKFWRITVPLITPSIFFQLIIATINAFQAFEFIYVLTRGGPNGATTTVVYSIYRNGFDFFRMGFASAQALVLAALIFALTLFYFWLQRKWVVYE